MLDNRYLASVIKSSEDKHLATPDDWARIQYLSSGSKSKPDLLRSSRAVDNHWNVERVHGIENKNPWSQACGCSATRCCCFLSRCRWTLIFRTWTACWTVFLAGTTFQIFSIISSTAMDTVTISNFAFNNAFTVQGAPNRNSGWIFRLKVCLACRQVDKRNHKLESLHYCSGRHTRKWDLDNLSNLEGTDQSMGIHWYRTRLNETLDYWSIRKNTRTNLYRHNRQYN